MPKPTKQTKPAKRRHDYDALRDAYRLTPTTLTDKAFSEKMGIPLRTFQEKKRKDAANGQPWERDLSPSVRSQTRQLQQRVAAGLDKDQPITDESVAIAAAATTNFLVLQQHEELFNQAVENIRDGMGLLKAHIQQGFIVVEKRTKEGPVFEHADISAEYVAKSMNGLSSALERTVKMQRHHMGLDNEDSEASYEDDLEALAKEMGVDGDN